jgi:aminoglycoside phosphotransferase (APT) family kinase protein
VQPIGPKLAEGRDSEIYEHGPGRVLRLARHRRPMVAEAEIMQYVRAKGYPCPQVHEAGDGFIVMDRLEGATMLDAAGRPPFPIRRFGRVLADLHERLHRIPAPSGLQHAPMPGDRLLHRDLHPLNVMITPEGPVVIDWSNASAGDPSFDVADAWALLACAAPPTKGIDRVVVPLGRRVLLHAFLSGVDRQAARAAVPAAVQYRLTDRNLGDAERARMQAFAQRLSQSG